MFSLGSSLTAFLSSFSPPGLILTVAIAFIGDGRKNGRLYLNEFIGTLLMIGLTFSPGKWIGTDSLAINWVSHAVGVIAADYICDGPHVNPAASFAMWSLGKCSYEQMLVHIAGAMGGGLVAFPMFQFFSEFLDWAPLGGPEYNPEGDEDGSSSASSEFFATFLLMVVVFIVNWELDFGKYHYWIKQTLTAVAIRFLIEVFPTAGPAMNPMLGTTWAVFSLGSYPEDVKHYYVYWVASILGALLASLVYAMHEGDKFFALSTKKIPVWPTPETKKDK